MEENKKKKHKIIRIVILIVLVVAIAIVGYFGTYKSETVKSFNGDGLMFELSSLNEDSYKDNYYYNKLDSYEQKVYQTFYYYSTNFEDSFYFMYKYDEDKFEIARSAFSLDYPEYYWWDECSLTKTSEKNLFKTYNYYLITSTISTKDDIVRDYQLVERKAKEISEDLLDLHDEYELYNTEDLTYEEFVDKYQNELYLVNIHGWLIEHVEYDENASNNQDIRSVFLDGKSVCAGYAEAFKYLCDLGGYDCICVNGTCTTKNKNGDLETENHEWNIVKCNDEYLNVDITWDDNDDDTLLYTYFLINDDNFTLSHTPIDTFEITKCDEDYSSLTDLVCAKSVYQKENNNLDVVSYFRNETFNNIRNGYKKLYYYIDNDDDYNSFSTWLDNGGFVSAYSSVYGYYDLHYSIVRDEVSRIISIEFTDSYH